MKNPTPINKKAAELAEARAAYRKVAEAEEREAFALAVELFGAAISPEIVGEVWQIALDVDEEWREEAREDLADAVRVTKSIHGDLAGEALAAAALGYYGRHFAPDDEYEED